MVNCASADYLEQYGIPEQLEDLSQHKLINYAGAVGEKQGVFLYQDGTVMMDSALSVNNTEAYIAAALQVWELFNFLTTMFRIKLSREL
jgi:hypothetical protein